MRTRQEVEKELREIEELEALEKENEKKEKNYKNFKERSADFMIGLAHAELNFINEKYQSDREKTILPATVSITGNMGTSFSGKAPTTSATQTYFRNVWNTSYTYYERQFEDELNKLTQKYIKKVCEDLVCVLEMMGLQSNHYFVTEKFFPKEKLKEVQADIEKAQADILNNYSDEQFTELIREQHGWKNSDGNEVEHLPDVNLSHSKMIMYRYIFKNRPSLQDAFKETEFYKNWKSRILE